MPRSGVPYADGDVHRGFDACDPATFPAPGSVPFIWCHARRTAPLGRWAVWADAAEVNRLRRLAKYSRLGQSSYPSELITPLPKKQ